MRQHDKQVSTLIREIVVLLEHGKLDRTKVPTDFGEREPTNLDEAEERLGHNRVIRP